MSQGDPAPALADGFSVDWIFVGASAPDTDLSVFPIVPPVDPACANTVALAAKGESTPNTSSNMIRQPAPFTPAMLRPPIARVAAAAFVAMGLEGVRTSPDLVDLDYGAFNSRSAIAVHRLASCIGKSAARGAVFRSGAPRPMKKSTIASPWRYDAASNSTPPGPNLADPAEGSSRAHSDRMLSEGSRAP